MHVWVIGLKGMSILPLILLFWGVDDLVRFYLYYSQLVHHLLLEPPSLDVH